MRNRSPEAIPEKRRKRGSDASSPEVATLTANTGESAKAAAEVKETPAELAAVIEKMRETAKKHNNFGFGSTEALDAFLEILPQKLSADSLATIRALKPRETEESYTVFFKLAYNNQIYLGESAPSSKGANGEEEGGVKIAATEAAKNSKRSAPADYYSAAGSAEALFTQLESAGARGLIRASRSMLKNLMDLKLYSAEIFREWLSDKIGGTTQAYRGLLANYSSADSATSSEADEVTGVRAMRDVTQELRA